MLRWMTFVVVAMIVVVVATLAEGMATTEPNQPITEESMEGRGKQKFGDKCNVTMECGFPGSVCDPSKKTCRCRSELTATDHLEKCGKEASINESCTFDEQCESALAQTECRDGRCVCKFEMVAIYKEGVWHCENAAKATPPGHEVDPAMIGILLGMALMFIIICVVLRLFSRARWRENRTIFNTPNPRLMNASLLQHKPDQRRGSKGSIRGPSRAPSVTSLRPHSPSVSQGSKNSRSNSRGSNHSARERSPTKPNNHTVLESVLVETEDKTT